MKNKKYNKQCQSNENTQNEILYSKTKSNSCKIELIGLENKSENSNISVCTNVPERNSLRLKLSSNSLIYQKVLKYSSKKDLEGASVFSGASNQILERRDLHNASFDNIHNSRVLQSSQSSVIVMGNKHNKSDTNTKENNSASKQTTAASASHPKVSLGKTQKIERDDANISGKINYCPNLKLNQEKVKTGTTKSITVSSFTTIQSKIPLAAKKYYGKNSTRDKCFKTSIKETNSSLFIRENNPSEKEKLCPINFQNEESGKGSEKNMDQLKDCEQEFKSVRLKSENNICLNRRPQKNFSNQMNMQTISNKQITVSNENFNNKSRAFCNFKLSFSLPRKQNNTETDGKINSSNCNSSKRFLNFPPNFNSSQPSFQKIRNKKEKESPSLFKKTSNKKVKGMTSLGTYRSCSPSCLATMTTSSLSSSASVSSPSSSSFSPTSPDMGVDPILNDANLTATSAPSKHHSFSLLDELNSSGQLFNSSATSAKLISADFTLPGRGNLIRDGDSEEIKTESKKKEGRGVEYEQDGEAETVIQDNKTHKSRSRIKRANRNGKEGSAKSNKPQIGTQKGYFHDNKNYEEIVIQDEFFSVKKLSIEEELNNKQKKYREIETDAEPITQEKLPMSREKIEKNIKTASQITNYKTHWKCEPIVMGNHRSLNEHSPSKAFIEELAANRLFTSQKDHQRNLSFRENTDKRPTEKIEAVEILKHQTAAIENPLSLPPIKDINEGPPPSELSLPNDPVNHQGGENSSGTEELPEGQGNEDFANLLVADITDTLSMGLNTRGLFSLEGFSVDEFQKEGISRFSETASKVSFSVKVLFLFTYSINT